MKKLIILSILTMSLMLSACGTRSTVTVNVDDTSLNNKVLGANAMIEIGNGLWYDSTTGIVYWWNGNITVAQWSTTPTPYYSSNGLLYRYIPSTNTFEEIEPMMKGE